MRRKVFGLTLSAMLFALSYSASAQQPKKVPRLGYLSNSDPATESTRSEAIRLALRELGYIEGNFGSSIIFDFEFRGQRSTS